jgi:hypothetical protein
LCGFVIGVLAVAVVGVVLCAVAVHETLRRPRGPGSDALGVNEHRDVEPDKVSRLKKVRISRSGVRQRVVFAVRACWSAAETHRAGVISTKPEDGSRRHLCEYRCGLAKAPCHIRPVCRVDLQDWGM